MPEASPVVTAGPMSADALRHSTRQRPAMSLPLVYALCFTAVVLTHWTLLQLPYFWDEGGYYVPAAYDFYRTGTLIPQFTNAHPPLPSVVLGLLWHVFGFHIAVTRVTACAFAAGGLAAVFALGRRLLGTSAGFVLLGLTAVYPIWFAQSSLAHADIFAAAFTLCGFAVYLTAPEVAGTAVNEAETEKNRRFLLVAGLFSLSVLAKETAIVQPAALAAAELWVAFRSRRNVADRRRHVRWTLAFSACLPVLLLWYGYHYLKTGFIFGNPVYLRYNATANLTIGHMFTALRYRFVHLFWQRNIWVPLLLALGCLALPRRSPGAAPRLSPRVLRLLALLAIANWVAFSILGGALLTRYLLPIYPLLLLVCVATWQERTRHWPWLAALTGVAFGTAIWINPSTFFAPEDNLTYRNMIVVHQEAIDVLQARYPDATVLTAWPAAGELTRPELGYTVRTFRVVPIENFTAPELARAAQQPGRYDTALVFTTHYITPGFRHDLLTHPNSWRARSTASQIDLLPGDIAHQLGGHVVWQDNRNGEWAAILRFDRSYNARVELSAH